MNKFEYINKINPPPYIRYRPTIAAIVKEMLQMKHAVYYGSLSTPRVMDESRTITQEDLSTLKHSVGYGVLEITSEVSHIVESAEVFNLNFKVIDGVLYVLYAMGQMASYAATAIFRFDIGTQKFIGINQYEKQPPTDVREELQRIADHVGDILRRLIICQLEKETVVIDYEPTNFAFTKKVPLRERELYRTYGFVKTDTVINSAEVKTYSRKTLLSYVHDPDPKRVKALHDSVLFTGLGVPADITFKWEKVDLSHVPFQHFSFLHTAPINDKVFSFLYHCVRKQHHLEITLYQDMEDKLTRLRLEPLIVFTLNDQYISKVIEYIQAPNRPAKEIRETSPVLLDFAKFSISHFLEKVMNFETTKVTGTLKTPNPRIHGTDVDVIAKNVHYVLDMSKRRSYPLTKSNRPTGFHMPEHDRIGHVRRYKSGKVVNIRPTTINKGKGDKYGRITKDYKI